MTGNELIVLYTHGLRNHRYKNVVELCEISFNASLISEMRAIAFVSRMLREQRLDAGRYKDLRLHMVDDDDHLSTLAPSSKFNTEWAFLEQLFEHGRGAADVWLSAHRKDVGKRSSLNLEATFLSPKRAKPDSVDA